MKKFCLVGSDIGYSLSPLIHSIVFEIEGIDATYSIEDIAIDSFDKEIKRIMKEYDGFSVTKPYKQTVLSYVKNVSKCNAVNVVCGSSAYNTDSLAFKQTLLDENIDLENKEVLVIGCGGAAEAVCMALDELKAKPYAYSRTKEKYEKFNKLHGYSLITRPVLVINCSTAGLNNDIPMLLDLDYSDVELYYDLIYFDTPLLNRYKSNGIKVMNGKKMLVYQAIMADSIFLNLQLNISMLYDIIKDRI